MWYIGAYLGVGTCLGHYGMSRIVSYYYLFLIADMKEPDDNASTTDSAFGSCSVVTGSTFIGTLHSQQYQEVRKFVVFLIP